MRGEIVDRLLQWAQNSGVAAREMDRYDFCSGPLFRFFFLVSSLCRVDLLRGVVNGWCSSRVVAVSRKEKYILCRAHKRTYNNTRPVKIINNNAQYDMLRTNNKWDYVVRTIIHFFAVAAACTFRINIAIVFFPPRA